MFFLIILLAYAIMYIDKTANTYVHVKFFFCFIFCFCLYFITKKGFHFSKLGTTISKGKYYIGNFAHFNFEFSLQSEVLLFTY